MPVHKGRTATLEGTRVRRQPRGRAGVAGAEPLQRRRLQPRQPPRASSRCRAHFHGRAARGGNLAAE